MNRKNHVGTDALGRPVAHTNFITEKPMTEKPVTLGLISDTHGLLRPEAVDALRETEVVGAGGVSIYILHDLGRLDLKPEAAGFRVVVYGHSHQPKIGEKNGVLYFNPGSAGPRRFRLPVSVGRLTITAGKSQPELVELKI